MRRHRSENTGLQIPILALGRLQPSDCPATTRLANKYDAGAVRPPAELSLVLNLTKLRGLRPSVRQPASMSNMAAHDQITPASAQTIHQRFSLQAALTPESTALITRDRRTSYRELEETSNRIARALMAMGIAHGQPVGLYLGRSAAMIAGMLGILKAGGAYAPLDPSDPPERLRGLLQEAGVDLVMCDGSMPLDHPAAQTLTISETSGESADEIGAEGAGSDPAYLMFTSGSTGQPKAVEIPHRGVLRLVAGDFCQFGPDRVFLHLSPPACDASTFEIWGPLLHGGCCAIYPDPLPTVSGIETSIATHRVTTLWLTAALFNAVIDEKPEILLAVEEVLAGGEALSVAHVKRALDVLPKTQLINGYGPTECTTFACCYRIPRDFGVAFDEGRFRSVPIGGPIAQTEVRILNEALKPVPAGSVGELCISGDGLAIGYRNRPKLTSQKFVTDTVTGVRFYRSGDQARMRDDGLIEFVGRFDDQVKIRGHRIELGEVEAALLRQPEVAEAAVVVRRLGQYQRQQLVAFVALRYGQSANPLQLRDSLHTVLPQYMIPNPIVVLPGLPKNHHGKVDRKALATAELPSHVIDDTERAEAGSVEAGIAERMAHILGIQEVGRNEDFFDLGGDSLSAMQLIRWVEATFEKKLQELNSLTPAAVASGIATGASGRENIVLMKEGSVGSGPVFFVHGIDGQVPLYSRLLRHRVETGPVFGLALPATAPADSIEAIAAYHVVNLKQFAPAGPYRLCGLSFGVKSWPTKWRGSLLRAEMLSDLLCCSIPVRLVFGLTGPGLNGWPSGEIALLPDWAFCARATSGRPFLTRGRESGQSGVCFGSRLRFIARFCTSRWKTPWRGKPCPLRRIWKK